MGLSRSSTGGGVALADGATLVVKALRMTGNVAACGDGGGVYARNANLAVHANATCAAFVGAAAA